MWSQDNLTSPESFPHLRIIVIDQLDTEFFRKLFTNAFQYIEMLESLWLVAGTPPECSAIFGFGEG